MPSTSRGTHAFSAAGLARVCTAAGARDVATFGHAGNLLFSAARSPAAIVARCSAAPSDKLYVVFLARKARKPPALPIESPVERLTAFACRMRLSRRRSA